MLGVNGMKLIGDDGRLPPALVGIIIILAFILGIIVGWFAHMNWSLRGEAKQIVEDMEVGEEIKSELDFNLIQLNSKMERTKNDPKFNKEECLGYVNPAYVDSLRDDLGDEEF